MDRVSLFSCQNERSSIQKHISERHHEGTDRFGQVEHSLFLCPLNQEAVVEGRDKALVDELAKKAVEVVKNAVAAL